MFLLNIICASFWVMSFWYLQVPCLFIGNPVCTNWQCKLLQCPMKCLFKGLEDDVHANLIARRRVRCEVMFRLSINYSPSHPHHSRRWSSGRYGKAAVVQVGIAFLPWERRRQLLFSASPGRFRTRKSLSRQVCWLAGAQPRAPERSTPQVTIYSITDMAPWLMWAVWVSLKLLQNKFGELERVSVIQDIRGSHLLERVFT